MILAHGQQGPGNNLAQGPEKNASRKNQRNPKENPEQWSWKDTTTQYGDKNKSSAIHKVAYRQYKKLKDEGRGRRHLWLQELAPKLQRVFTGGNPTMVVPGEILGSKVSSQSH